MIGYQVRDYSGNYHGICQSEACRKRFKEWSSGLNLPLEEDENDTVYRKYQQFKWETSNELFYRVNAFIKSKDPDICICTFTHAGIDLLRKESGSYLNNRPAWEYHSTENVKLALGSFKERQITNTAVHFVDIPYRHASVSPHLTGMRLIENMFSGGGLDFYCIGRLDNQEDRAALKVVKDIYQFHKKHEQYFTNIQSNADVCLLQGDGQLRSNFRGFIRILAENHILFDAMESWRLDYEDTPKKLEDYNLVILPDIRKLSDGACKRLDEYVKNGGTVLATGYTSTLDELGNPQDKFRLKAAGIASEYAVQEKKHGTYIRIYPRDKQILKNPSFEDLDLVYVFGDFLECKTQNSAKGMLGLIRPAMYGPPEKCYYTDVTDIPGMIYNQYGEGRFVYIPWQIGRHYEYRVHHGHAMLVMAALNDLIGYKQHVELYTSPLVEITCQRSQDGSFAWLGLANHSGQIGTAFHAPVPIYDFRIRFKPDKKVKSVQLLKSEKKLDFSTENGWILLTVPRLDEFEMVLFEYE